MRKQSSSAVILVPVIFSSALLTATSAPVASILSPPQKAAKCRADDVFGRDRTPCRSCRDGWSSRRATSDPPAHHAGDGGSAIAPQPRDFVAAAFVGQWAAWMKGTAARWINRIRDFPADRCSFPPGHVHIRDGIEQETRIWMQGMGKNLPVR